MRGSSNGGICQNSSRTPSVAGFRRISARLDLPPNQRYIYYENQQVVAEGDFGLAKEDGVVEMVGFEPGFVRNTL